MIVGLSGYAQSGKDTVANHLVEHYGFTRIAFADSIREALYRLNPSLPDVPDLPGVTLKSAVDSMGWEFVKNISPHTRALLQRFGTEVARDLWDEDFWVDLAMKKASSLDKVVITDVRYPNELEAILKANGDVWRIIKPNIAPVNRHASEVALDHYQFNRIILNDTSLENLYATVDYLIQH
jgi:dephospho-CoA kinase